MSYYRFAETAVALCFGLTFALVGWWEIAGEISRALWWPEERGTEAPRHGSRFSNIDSKLSQSRQSIWSSLEPSHGPCMPRLSPGIATPPGRAMRTIRLTRPPRRDVALSSPPRLSSAGHRGSRQTVGCLSGPGFQAHGQHHL